MGSFLLCFLPHIESPPHHCVPELRARPATLMHACPSEVQKRIGASIVFIVSNPGALSLIPPWVRTGELS